MEHFWRIVYRWNGLDWVEALRDEFDAFPPGNLRFPPPVPSAKGPTASTTMAEVDGMPYLYERWFRWVPATWGTGGEWEVATEGGNWT